MRFLLFLLLPLCLFSDGGIDSDVKLKPGDPRGPWLTGPLLTPFAFTVPVGSYNIEPYVLTMHDLGRFSSRGHLHKSGPNQQVVNTVVFCILGITEWVDISLFPQFIYNYGIGSDRIGMGDMTVGASYQVLREDPRYHGLTLRVGLNQVFPCGKFENLNPLISGTDGLGGGGWSTDLYISGSNVFHLRKENFLVPKIALSTIFYTPINIHGKNFYGGDGTTDGTLSRGISVILDMALEVTLSLHWALSLDIENIYSTGSTFKGTTEVAVGNPNSSYVLSFAPAIEYNFSEKFGLIAGFWFSAYGTNIEDFANVVIAFNCYL